MNVVIDMNLPPALCGILEDADHAAIHWSQIGPADATDKQIIDWACENGYIVLTHDLDFGSILAASGAQRPSVVQVRTQDLSPESLGDTILAALDQFAEPLRGGALITIDKQRRRARILPIG